MNLVLRYASLGPVKSFCHQRLMLLEQKFNLHGDGGRLIVGTRVCCRAVVGVPLGGVCAAVCVG